MQRPQIFPVCAMRPLAHVKCSTQVIRTMSNAQLTQLAKLQTKYEKTMVEVKTSTKPNAGRGVFAKVDFAAPLPHKDTSPAILRYMGKVLTVEEVEALPSTVYVVQYSKDWFIDGSDERISGAGSLVNTSKDESDFNARLVSHSGGVWWHPIKAIKAGSEIFGSYGRDEDVDFPDASLMVEEEERPAKRVRFVVGSLSDSPTISISIPSTH